MAENAALEGKALHEILKIRAVKAELCYARRTKRAKVPSVASSGFTTITSSCAFSRFCARLMLLRKARRKTNLENWSSRGSTLIPRTVSTVAEEIAR